MTQAEMTKLSIADVAKALHEAGYGTAGWDGKETLCFALYKGLSDSGKTVVYDCEFIDNEGEDGFSRANVYVWIEYTPIGTVLKAEF